MRDNSTVAVSPESTLRAAVDEYEHELAGAAAPRSREEWLAVVGDSQEVMNRLTALQDVAIARAARYEPAWEGDGTLGEVEHGPGRVALDAADVVAPRLGASHHQAQDRVEQAVRVAAAWEPVPTDAGSRPERNGLGGLHVAMREGRLDGYRAGVVAFELSECPVEVAEAVVAALDPYFETEPAAGLRRRTRTLLARISPDLLRQRATRARRETGLRRWVGEPGVDVWHGTFPSEDSATAWAAVDTLARRYVLDGVCSTIDRARAKALTDLVTQQASVDVQVVLTVPADGVPIEAADAEDAAEAGTTGADEASVVPTEAHEASAVPTEAGASDAVAADSAAADAAAGDGGVPEPPSSTTTARTVQGEDLVQVQGSRPSEPLLVPAAWLGQHTTGAARAVCDPDTGARLDPLDELGSRRYRPGDRLVALVRARDGRCRFPGCHVSARFCDLDHVRPWPIGGTTAANMICLCRRHHRIKQSPGWRLRLRPDGTATWTDPAGRMRTTVPLDALESVVLPTDPSEAEAPAARLSPEQRLALLPDPREERRERLLDQRDALRAITIRITWSDLLAEARRRERDARYDELPPF